MHIKETHGSGAQFQVNRKTEQKMKCYNKVVTEVANKI